MKLGMMVRADDAGLGAQSLAAFQHLHPDATLIVSMGDLTKHAEHPERFPGAKSAIFPDQVAEALKWLASESDVVLSFETFYEPDAREIINTAGARAVLWGNFELTIDDADLFLAPSTWRLDEWPAPTILLPFPVDREAFPFRLRTQARTFMLPVAKAMKDRCGSLILYKALRHVTSEVTVVVRSQTQIGAPRVPPNVTLQMVHGNVSDYREVYRGDVLIHPRRYGGLSLPLNEASSLGMAVITLDRDPERSLLPPAALVACREDARTFRARGGVIQWADADPQALAAKIDQLASDDALVEKLSLASDDYASEISWARMLPGVREALA